MEQALKPATRLRSRLLAKVLYFTNFPKSFQGDGGFQPSNKLILKL